MTALGNEILGLIKRAGI